ncbi:MAG: hypothetical protein LBE92_17250 [Chryseobacterium sp.]|jgi:hypothetical protein|uniref:hypothetical protein n=1 Tax=Chryseobacterium sp. TaxID=1871047 RepID=UPI00282A3E39|nr:hypothetical protein [Chryseobacterium sp.]MDR2237873.1 hypothetical protein [Chryseobacterium sp.]
MELHQKKFNEIRKLLQSRLGDRVKISEEYGNERLELKDSSFWMMTDQSELTVGYGANHTHFSTDYNNLEDGIIMAFDLLTNPVKTTQYIKGNTVFRVMTEIEYPGSKPVNIGTTSILIYPFWKKTKTEITVSEGILDRNDIREEVNLILNEE